MTQAWAVTRGAGLSKSILANLACDFSSFSPQAVIDELLFDLFNEPIELGLPPEHVVLELTYWNSGLFKFVPRLIDNGGLPECGGFNSS